MAPVAVAAAALLLLAGCATPPPVEVREVAVGPPGWMLEPCPETPIRVQTFGDLVRQLEVTELERGECADRIRDLREWADREVR